MGSVLLEAGLAKLSSFGLDRISDAHVLMRAEQSAKQQKLKVILYFFLLWCTKGKARTDTSLFKIWENYVEGEQASNGSTPESKQKEILKV
jgi:staphylococcal nuclease domain-containing protein 1